MASFAKSVQQPISHPVIALVAGEASGDTLGEGLIRSLKQRFPHATFIGVGGTKMIGQGLQSFFPMEKLSVMGIFEVLKHLPELLKLRSSLIQTLLALKPDVFIGIDAPDFNFKIERVLKSNGIKTIHYVGPSVWAWREKRLVKIKQCVDGVLVLFPFETPYYDKYQIPVKFVGHPLANEVPESPNLEQARVYFQLSVLKTVVGLLPGSRMSEIRLMTPVYLQAAKKLLEIMPDLHFLIPCVHQAAQLLIAEQVALLGLQKQITLVSGQAQKVMEASNFLIVTSGTATLEAALMKRPIIIAIKVHPFSYWLMKKLSTTQWIGLPNVLAQQSLIPEFIQEEATADKIALALGKLMADTKQQHKQLAAFDVQYHQLKQNASELAADAVVDWANLSQPLTH
ncbi:lipid-A-disaccharide synthase [Thiosulfativibrio zosterae]|uniref:Lipid-A-disaccharide synthase n=1 Tax=Thiosulfativibrio zosterae TaxID=2675053 RepID=A0A6F8PNM5_9GAMM|nr:lipid-A-disaccharide synthase [Thiosulfativibrio zosterae]BBP43644.1 lipid-A-disaccharide synthase [Thiosulfativibrio zosterae]